MYLYIILRVLEPKYMILLDFNVDFSYVICWYNIDAICSLISFNNPLTGEIP